MDKKIPQWVVNLTVVLLLGAYAFVFTSIVERMNKVEKKVEDLNPILLQIQMNLSGIKADLVWIKKQIN